MHNTETGVDQPILQQSIRDNNCSILCAVYFDHFQRLKLLEDIVWDCIFWAFKGFTEWCTVCQFFGQLLLQLLCNDYWHSVFWPRSGMIWKVSCGAIVYGNHFWWITTKLHSDMHPDNISIPYQTAAGCWMLEWKKKFWENSHHWNMTISLKVSFRRTQAFFFHQLFFFELKLIPFPWILIPSCNKL